MENESIDDDFLYGEELEHLSRLEFTAFKPRQTAATSPLTPTTSPPSPDAPLSRAGQMWTREEDEKLVEKYLARVGPSQIADDLGRSLESIVKRIKTISFPFQEDEPEIPLNKQRTGKWLDSEDNYICESYKAGLSLADVALSSGRSVNQICMRLARLGVAVPQSLDDVTYYTIYKGDGLTPSKQGQKWTDEDRAALEAAFNAGNSLMAQAEQFERTPQGIVYQLYRLGLLTDEDLSKMVENAQSAAD